MALRSKAASKTEYNSRPFTKSNLAGRSFCLGVMPIPCPHFKITIVKRSQGQSAVAGAAYQNGERLFSEYDQRTKFYNKKKELVHAEIMLPSHAPPEYADRATLWNAVDWNDQKYAEVWRHSWEATTNRYLEAAGRPERVDLRSFERQGIQQIPTVHLGPAAHQMEKRGIETFLGNLNRDIRAANSLMQSIRSAIRGLQRWIADLSVQKQLLLDALEKAKEPTLSDLLVDYFNLRNEQRSDWSGKAKLKCTVRDFEEVKRAVDYLKAHSLNTIEDLDTAISNLNQTAAPLRRQLKQNENRMRAIAQIKDAAAVHAKLKPIHDTFIKKSFKLTKDAYAAQHKDELESFNKAVRTLMKLNGSTAVDVSALDAEFSALQSSSAELRTQLETLQPDISALKNIRKYIDMVLNKQQLSAPGGKTSEKESVLKRLHKAKATAAPKKPEQQKNTPEL
jgi:prefoldin subunit 5